MNYYRLGARFRLDRDNEEYLLAQVDTYMFALIGLTSGNRWSNPVYAKDRVKNLEDTTGLNTLALDYNFIRFSLAKGATMLEVCAGVANRPVEIR